METEGRSAWLKVRVRVLLPLLILTVLSSLDRVNISFAALQLNPTLGLSAEQYGVAVGVFFFAYLLFQFPSMWLQRRLGTRLWIAVAIGVSWGVVAVAMAFVHDRKCEPLCAAVRAGASPEAWVSPPASSFIAAAGCPVAIARRQSRRPCWPFRFPW